jgi:DNA-binding response OmpR family regulator
MTERKQLGRILLKRQYITQAALDSALQSQRASGQPKPLASLLMENGQLSELDALKALSEQFGLPGLELGQITIDLTHLELVPREVALRSKVLPVLVHEDQLFLAMANPADQRVIDELEFVTGRKVRPYIALEEAIRTATRKAYDAKESGARHYFGPAVPEGTRREVTGAYAQVRKASVPPPAPNDGFALDLGEVGQPVPGQLGPNDWSTIGQLPDKSARHAPTGKTILVVEDEADIRDLLERVLTAQGHAVITADRGTLALERVKQHNPDLIVLDAMLPELHGFEIARRLKSSERYCATPILMVSAVHRGWRVAEDAKSNLKIDEYIEKPFRISDVTAAVKRLLEQRAGAAPRDPESLAEEAKQLLDEGVAAYRAGNARHAIALLKRATEVDPLAFRPHYHLGLLHAKQGNSFEALSELERAVELHPKSFAAMKNLAILYEQAGFLNKARELWERCVHATEDVSVQKEVRAHLLSLL